MKEFHSHDHEKKKDLEHSNENNYEVMNKHQVNDKIPDEEKKNGINSHPKYHKPSFTNQESEELPDPPKRLLRRKSKDEVLSEMTLQ